MKKLNDFLAWMGRVGYRRQGAAGRAIGLMSDPTITAVVHGRRELTLTERLAMSAVRAGLQPWTPDYDAELMAAQQERLPANAA